MSKLAKIIAWGMLSLSIISFICAAVAGLEDTPESTNASFGFLLIGLFFGFPGGLLLFTVTRGEKRRNLDTLLLGLLRTHDQFTVAEIAQKLGGSEAETEQLIIRAVAQHRLDLVFHRSDRTYMHRDRIRRDCRVYDRCGACGASLQHELAIEGEAITCPYCNSRVDAQSA